MKTINYITHHKNFISGFTDSCLADFPERTESATKEAWRLFDQLPADIKFFNAGYLRIIGAINYDIHCSEITALIQKRLGYTYEILWDEAEFQTAIYEKMLGYFSLNDSGLVRTPGYYQTLINTVCEQAFITLDNIGTACIEQEVREHTALFGL